MEPVRVLHVINGMGSGGAESFIMNIYRNIDREKIQFDFLVRSSKEKFYFEEINKLGGKIYIMPPFPKNFIRNYRETKLFLKTHKKYKIIHVHGNALIYIIPLIIAHKLNIPCRIMHSHNTNTRRKIYKPIHYLNKMIINSLITDSFACSQEAGEWMFNHNDFKVIKNGIDVEKFLYSEICREEIRKELNIEQNFVVGHVGRFLNAKNHVFLVDVFNDICKRKDNAILILVGTGPLETEIKRKIKNLNLADKVIFIGERSDVNKLMCAFDTFVFPSIFEGLGIAVVEAQASGLPCIISDTIPREVAITGLVKFLSITRSSQVWSDEILSCESQRNNMYNEMTKSGFNVKQLSEKLQEFYLNNSI